MKELQYEYGDAFPKERMSSDASKKLHAYAEEVRFYDKLFGNQVPTYDDLFKKDL